MKRKNAHLLIELIESFTQVPVISEFATTTAKLITSESHAVNTNRIFPRIQSGPPLNENDKTTIVLDFECRM